MCIRDWLTVIQSITGRVNGLSSKQQTITTNALTDTDSSVPLWRNLSCSYNVKKTKEKTLIKAEKLSTNDLTLLWNGVLFCWNSVTLLMYRSLLERRLQLNQTPEVSIAWLRVGPISQSFSARGSFVSPRTPKTVGTRVTNRIHYLVVNLINCQSQATLANCQEKAGRKRCHITHQPS